MDATPPRIWKIPNGTCDFTAMLTSRIFFYIFLSFFSPGNIVPRSSLARTRTKVRLIHSQSARLCGHAGYILILLVHTYTSPVSSSPPSSLATASFNPHRTSPFPSAFALHSVVPEPTVATWYMRACAGTRAYTHTEIFIGVPSLFIEVVAPPHLRRCSVSFEVRDVVSIIRTPLWVTINVRIYNYVRLVFYLEKPTEDEKINNVTTAQVLDPFWNFYFACNGSMSIASRGAFRQTFYIMFS